MPTTRSSSGRQSAQAENSAKQQAKNGQTEKTQTTLDKALEKTEESKDKDTKKEEAAPAEEPSDQQATDGTDKVEKTKRQSNETEGEPATKKLKQENEAKDDSAKGDTKSKDDIKGAEELKERPDAVSSDILEEGIIYFFTRARVNEEHPESAQDLQRSFFVMRPLPKGAKIGEGPIQDSSNCRLVALPKKVFPKVSGRDKYLSFVEKVNCSMEDLKKTFFAGADYDTATAGVSHQQPVTPIGEGVYALTSRGRDAHLAYMLTIPQEAGEVQEELGVKSRASFIVSMRNPETPQPKSIAVPPSPEYPKEVLDRFRGLRWMAADPQLLNYINAQILMIAESDPESNLAASTKKEEEEHKSPYEELERLEHEDETRIKNMKGDLSIFDDLHISSKDYPKVKTTW